MSNAKKPRCPVCDTAKFVTLQGVDGDMGYCGKCKGTFDAIDPDEGSDYSDRYPDARLIRQEQQRSNRFPRRP